MNVLIGYASAHGSTAEIAEFMSRVFKERNVSTTVAPVHQVQSVAPYNAVILGSAVHGGMWLTPMSQFLERFEPELGTKRVYFFITCIRVLEPDGLEHSLQNYIHRETLDRAGVRDVGVFAGKLQLDAIDWKERWTLSLRYDGQEIPGALNDDFRDWTAIRAWTTRVRDQLGLL